MANVFEGVWNALKHPLDEAQFLFDVGRGKIDLKDAPGEHQRMMNKTTVPILGDNKIAKNSDAIAGTIVGGILAAPLVAGATGSAGSASGAGSSIGGFGTEGAFSNAFKPSNIGNWLGGKWDSMVGPSDAELGNLADMEAGGALDMSGADALKKANPRDWSSLGDALMSIKLPQQQNIGHSGGRVGGRFNFDSKRYENPLLTREYNQLYNEPLYRPLNK